MVSGHTHGSPGQGRLGLGGEGEHLQTEQERVARDGPSGLWMRGWRPRVGEAARLGGLGVGRPPGGGARPVAARGASVHERFEVPGLRLGAKLLRWVVVTGGQAAARGLAVFESPYVQGALVGGQRCLATPCWAGPQWACYLVS